jgi:hypothetical protein
MLHDKEELISKIAELYEVKEKMRNRRVCVEIATISTR